MCFAPKCNTSPGLAGAVGSSYEDYSVTKDMKKHSGKHSGKANRDQVLGKLAFGKPYSVYAYSGGVWSHMFFFGYLVNRYPPPPPWQCFHLVDKLITAWV